MVLTVAPIFMTNKLLIVLLLLLIASPAQTQKQKAPTNRPPTIRKFESSAAIFESSGPLENEYKQ